MEKTNDKVQMTMMFKLDMTYNVAIEELEEDFDIIEMFNKGLVTFDALKIVGTTVIADGETHEVEMDEEDYESIPLDEFQDVLEMIMKD